MVQPEPFSLDVCTATKLQLPSGLLSIPTDEETRNLKSTNLSFRIALQFSRPFFENIIDKPTLTASKLKTILLPSGSTRIIGLFATNVYGERLG